MSYDAIVFDMDGVLLEGYHTDRAIYRRAAEETLSDFDTQVSEVPDDLVDPADAASVRSRCATLDLPADAFWAYREHAATALENRRIEAGDRQPFEDTTVLSRLSSEYRLGIVSNNRNGTVRFVTDHAGWAKDVHATHGRYPTLEGYDRMKPDPYYLERTLDDLEVRAADTLFVGDRVSDVTTARRAGTDSAMLVRNGNGPAADVDPNYRITSLLALCDLLAHCE